MRRQTLEDFEVIVLKVVIVLTIVFCSLLWFWISQYQSGDNFRGVKVHVSK